MKHHRSRSQAFRHNQVRARKRERKKRERLLLDLGLKGVPAAVLNEELERLELRRKLGELRPEGEPLATRGATERGSAGAPLAGREPGHTGGATRPPGIWTGSRTE